MPPAPPDDRKAVMRQIALQAAAIRRKLDPKVLDRAKVVAEGGEIYDREAAQKIVGEFLKGKTRTDGGVFQQELMARLRGVKH
jgi:hypothetical protein